MKLTIEIPDAHTGDLLQFLATLTARPLPEPLHNDPAPGHPELPLEGIDAADPLRVAMDATTEPVKSLDWPELPNGIPAPPDGFAFVTTEMLPAPANDPTDDILWLCQSGAGAKWIVGGWVGGVEGPWAVRIGSDIAKANGIV